MTEKISSRAQRRGREQRRMSVPLHVERRAASDGAASAPVLQGFACVTNSPYPMADEFGPYTEVIERGAFGSSLANQDDVRLLFDHQGVPMARTKSGTMQLSEITDPADDPTGTNTTGLWVNATLDPNSYLSQSIMSAMNRGDLDEMSFAFQVVNDGQVWSASYDQRNITNVKVFDVSMVTYPANPATSAALHSDDIVDLADMSDEEIRAAIKRLESRLTPASKTFDLGLLEAELELS